MNGGRDGSLAPGHTRRRGVALRLVLSVCVLGLVCGAANAQAATLFAYPNGTGTPSGCPTQSTTASGCSLGTALSDAAAGDTVMLASPGASAGGQNYVGNWSIGTSGTSAGSPVTIDGSGVSGATLDGNGKSNGACSTGSCFGPVLTVTNAMFLVIKDVTIQNANNNTSGNGGGLQNDAGGTVTITDSTFSGDDTFDDGAAIDNGDGGSGTITVTDSTLTGNFADVNGGAIDNADNGGSGTVTVTDSTLSDNEASNGHGVTDGGAINNSGSGLVTISGSTFSSNLAEGETNGGVNDGGAINSSGGTIMISSSSFTGNAIRDDASATNDGGAISITGGTVTISGSTFSSNEVFDATAANDGGAIDNVGGTLTLSGSTFTGDTAVSGDGGAVDNADSGSGTVTVSDSTFSGDSATDGPEIDTSDNSGNGVLVLSGSTLAPTSGAAVTAGANSGTGELFAAGDVFSAGCQQNGGTWSDQGYNVGADGTCFNGGTGDKNAGSVAALNLGSLASNGGATQTIALGTGSKAIGIVPNPKTVTLNSRQVPLCTGSTVDQRGDPRPGTGKGACDAGAFETQLGTLYAYANGASATSGCPQTSTTSKQCSLGRALGLAAAGDMVMLATAGASAGGANYVGNWSVGVSGTSSGAPVTIDGSGVSDATLDGNNGNGSGCTTASCLGPVLTVSNSMFLAINDVTIQNAVNISSGSGGGVENDAGGTVAISGSTFTGDTAAFNGGAVENGANSGSGTVTITDSSFASDTAGQGGAVDNGDFGGSGTVVISGSTFTGDTATNGDGGAVDNADHGGSGTVTVSDSTFSGDSAVDGGEIDTSDNSGSGTLVLSASTLVPAQGPAVTAGRNGGTGQVFAAGDVFAAGCQQTGGTWTDKGYNAAADGTCLNGGTGDKNAGSVAALDLGSLAASGGATQTIGLGTGSKAIGIVPNPTSVTLNSQQVGLCPGSDQRGIPRPGTGKASCDAGAFETQLSTLYAYANGSSSTSGCPRTATASEQCSLARALGLAGAGDTVMLATPGASGSYVGNWSIGPTGTSASARVTIDGSGVSAATLDGNKGSSSGCTTATCDGPVLTVSNNMFLVIKDVTIEDGDATAGFGGGLQNDFGGTVMISGSTFSGNTATTEGGAIDNAGSPSPSGGSGTVTITGSTFTGNTAGDYGAAISNGGGGFLGGVGTVAISDSTFTGNTSGSEGGAIDNGGNAASETSTITVSGSTFAGNTSGDGGAIDNADGGGSGTVFVAADVFAGNCAQNSGTWTDQGHNAGSDGTCFNGGPGDVNAGSVAALDLGSLASNGGATQTIALAPGSPAAGVIPNPTTVTLNGAQVALCPGTDQRGDARPGDGKAECDAGAYESQPAVPSVQITTPADGSSYGEATSVQASFSCAEGAGGPGLVAGSGGCQGTVANGTPIDTSTGGSHAFTVTATSRDGLTKTVTVHYTVPSASAPSVQITTPADGATYAIGAPVQASYSCAEGTGGPGLASGSGGCQGTVPDGSAVDTSSAGSHVFSVTATSVDGLTTTDAVHYTVLSAPPASTSSPAVTGTAKAGQKLACSAGAWSSSPSSYSYQWSRDGTAIVGATSATYTVQQLDEGTTLTCTVIATNASGQGSPATSAPLKIPVPFVARCPAASGSVSGTTLGLLKLGMTRAQAEHANPHSSTRGKAFQEFFCLTPRGVRVGYASPKELASLPKHARARYASRVIWISTSSAFYAIDGVRVGATVAAAGKRLRLEPVFVVGLNDWCLAPAGAVTVVLKVRQGIVQEIGIGAKNLTKTRKAQRRFLTSFE